MEELNICTLLILSNQPTTYQAYHPTILKAQKWKTGITLSFFDQFAWNDIKTRRLNICTWFIYILWVFWSFGHSDIMEFVVFNPLPSRTQLLFRFFLKQGTFCWSLAPLIWCIRLGHGVFVCSQRLVEAWSAWLGCGAFGLDSSFVLNSVVDFWEWRIWWQWCVCLGYALCLACLLGGVLDVSMGFCLVFCIVGVASLVLSDVSCSCAPSWVGWPYIGCVALLGLWGDTWTALLGSSHAT